jgi:thioredoxin 1
VVRKSRPWGSDVTLAVELLTQKMQDYQQEQESTQDAVQVGDANKTNTTSDDLSQTPKEGETTMSDIPNNAPVAVTDQDFQELVIDHSNEMPVIVDFWAEWCGPCRMVAPIMEKLAEEYAGKVRVAKVDTDANPGLSQAFRIMSIPTNMIFKGGHLVFSQPGAFPEEAYRDLLNQVIDLDVEAAIAEAKAKEAEEQE